ncbi:uncharacterized protein LOC117181259 [Belonocnema kinseyi]|uniref:uncharacterized protein LOC117181259 n=1 Tax=Belonocnema kinseyi TaxID=2817044 RepID=UPI00143D857E|nr:uncharacterized protein LOC117181259 [Belonocnema kinseyi]
MGKFPVGHPKIYVGDECKGLAGPNYTNLKQIDGLIRCHVIPPRNLYHPVLPVRMHGKLMFPLCHAYCKSMSQSNCTDEDAPRELEGTWVADELNKSIELNYRVTDISEIWEYQVTQYDTKTRKGALFVAYVNTFLKIKHESSGWPSECLDEASKENYLREHVTVEGIELDREMVFKNRGLRSVGKLCLNSFWGKFGQRANLPHTNVVEERRRLLELLTNPELELHDITTVNDDVLYATRSYKDEAGVASPYTNVVIAAYTTAQARPKLFDYLYQLDRPVFYYDTDSSIYICHTNLPEYNPSLGRLLGQMTDELEVYGKGSYIDTFVSGGPKFYAYSVTFPDRKSHQVCKLKGITLNYKNLQVCNFETIREMVVSNAPPISISFRAIRRSKFHDVMTRTEKKPCKPVHCKRRFFENYESLPYGYDVEGENMEHRK